MASIDLAAVDVLYLSLAIVRIDEVGQLTFDFAVDVIPNSCLETVYGSSGRSDLALALPRHRIEGLQTVSNDQEDLETKEIGCRFDQTTGMFELATRVHNYSLLDTGSSVAVDFFVGDPRDPESLLAGQTATIAGIPPQSSDDNEEDVRVFVDAGCDGAGSVDAGCRTGPDDLSGSCVPGTRLFVQLDRTQAIAEVSEDNNIGWAALRSNCSPAIPVS